MKVLVDTSVWSFALRRRRGERAREEAATIEELAELIREHRVQMIGPIRQELLSGIRDEAQFASLQRRLRAFVDEPLQTEDYESAARANNQCRASGVTGSAVDFLICAVALERGWSVFTADRDFHAYGRVLPIRLHGPR